MSTEIYCRFYTLSKNSVSGYNAYSFILVMTGSEKTEHDIRNDPLRTEEREKDLVITGGIKCHVQKCLTCLIIIKSMLRVNKDIFLCPQE